MGKMTKEKELSLKGRVNMMKSTGIVRQIDPLGRIVLPRDLRKSLNLNDHDSVEFFLEGNTIVIKKYLPTCIFCGNAENLVSFKGKCVCPSCAKKLQILTEDML